MPLPCPGARAGVARWPLGIDMLEFPMHSAHQYEFRPASLRDLPMLTQWQARPHVRTWWGDEPPYDHDELADPRVARWIVSRAGQDFAYMQDYTVHGWADHHFADLPTGSRGIDQYIGSPKMIGQGHGTGFIGARIQALFAAGAPAIATDPHPDNKRAIAAYEKLGFERAGPAQETQWGIIQPMHAWARAT